MVNSYSLGSYERAMRGGEVVAAQVGLATGPVSVEREKHGECSEDEVCECTGSCACMNGEASSSMVVVGHGEGEGGRRGGGGGGAQAQVGTVQVASKDKVRRPKPLAHCSPRSSPLSSSSSSSTLVRATRRRRATLPAMFKATPLHTIEPTIAALDRWSPRGELLYLPPDHQHGIATTSRHSSPRSISVFSFPPRIPVGPPRVLLLQTVLRVRAHITPRRISPLRTAHPVGPSCASVPRTCRHSPTLRGRVQGPGREMTFTESCAFLCPFRLSGTRMVPPSLASLLPEIMDLAPRSQRSANRHRGVSEPDG
ncbi:hypothetical protein CERSUDRAFT_124982 [Gelatoporia subvermispora B]|uniref:Uncharacterized protein n=1 Tax=Ceriporiopsis subvermispora (strain B) TaxID=914234 RepID=M2QD64_CERS8|nr:hypothetical protein CERSUDRAFT_124982 [Gelatoporia subvermispora B]